jgi:hypothetical protein
VGKSETFLKLPYLQNDMQQDGGRTNVCLRLLLLIITKGWIGQVNFGTEVNCNNFVHCMQNNSSFKFFKHCYIFGLKIMQLDQFIFPG